MIEYLVGGVQDLLQRITGTGMGLGVGPGILDLILAGFVAVGAVQGFLRGGVRQIGDLAGIVGGLWVGFHYADKGAALLERIGQIPDQMEMHLGFLAVFVAVQLGARLAALVASSAVGVIGLGGLNRAFGGALGGFKAALIASILLTVGGEVGVPDPQTKVQSRWYPPVKKVLPMTWRTAKGIIPSSVISQAEDVSQLPKRLARKMEAQAKSQRGK